MQRPLWIERATLCNCAASESGTSSSERTPVSSPHCPTIGRRRTPTRRISRSACATVSVSRAVAGVRRHDLADPQALCLGIACDHHDNDIAVGDHPDQTRQITGRPRIYDHNIAYVFETHQLGGGHHLVGPLQRCHVSLQMVPTFIPHLQWDCGNLAA